MEDSPLVCALPTILLCLFPTDSSLIRQRSLYVALVDIRTLGVYLPIQDLILAFSRRKRKQSPGILPYSPFKDGQAFSLYLRSRGTWYFVSVW